MVKEFAKQVFEGKSFMIGLVIVLLAALRACASGSKVVDSSPVEESSSATEQIVVMSDGIIWMMLSARVEDIE